MRNIIQNIEKKQIYLQQKLIPLVPKKLRTNFQIFQINITLSSESSKKLEQCLHSFHMSQIIPENYFNLNLTENNDNIKIPLSLIQDLKKKNLDHFLDQKLIEEINEKIKKESFLMTLRLISFLSGYFYFHERKITANKKEKNRLFSSHEKLYDSFINALEKALGLSFFSKENMLYFLNKSIENDSSLSNSEREKIIHFQLAGGAFAWSERAKSDLEKKALTGKYEHLIVEGSDSSKLFNLFSRKEGFLVTRAMNDIVTQTLSRYIDQKNHEMPSLEEDYKELPKMVRARLMTLKDSKSIKTILYRLFGKDDEYKNEIENLLANLFIKEGIFQKDYFDVKNVNKLIGFLLRQYYSFISINPLSFNNSVAETIKGILVEIIQLFFERKYYTTKDYDILLDIFKNFHPELKIYKSVKKNFESLIRNFEELNFGQKIKLMNCLVNNEIKDNKLDPRISELVNSTFNNHKDEVYSLSNDQVHVHFGTVKIINEHNDLVYKKSNSIIFTSRLIDQRIDIFRSSKIKKTDIKIENYHKKKISQKLDSEKDKSLISDEKSVTEEKYKSAKSEFKSKLSEFIHYNISFSCKAEKFMSSLDNLIESNNNLINYCNELIKDNFKNESYVNQFFEEIKNISGNNQSMKTHLMKDKFFKEILSEEARFLSNRKKLIDELDQKINGQSNKTKIDKKNKKTLTSKNKFILSKVKQIKEKAEKDNNKLVNFKTIFEPYSKLTENPFLVCFKINGFLGQERYYDSLLNRYKDKENRHSNEYITKISNELDENKLISIFEKIITFFKDSEIEIESFAKNGAFLAKIIAQVQEASGNVVSYLSLDNHIVGYFNDQGFSDINLEADLGRNYFTNLILFLKELLDLYNKFPLDDRTIPAQNIEKAVASLDQIAWRINRFMSTKSKSLLTGKNSSSFFEWNVQYAESRTTKERFPANCPQQLP